MMKKYIADIKKYPILISIIIISWVIGWYFMLRGMSDFAVNLKREGLWDSHSWYLLLMENAPYTIIPLSIALTALLVMLYKKKKIYEIEKYI